MTLISAIDPCNNSVFVKYSSIQLLGAVYVENLCYSSSVLPCYNFCKLGFQGFGPEDDCPKNELKEEQHCFCGNGRKISKVLNSWHDNSYTGKPLQSEDRTYHFECTDIPGNIGGFQGEQW